jgi:hypothetical protein
VTKEDIKAKCDASNKLKDDDSGSNKSKQYATITVMQTLN